MKERLKRAQICVPIVAASDDEVLSQVKKIIDKCKNSVIDIAEFRADYYNGLADLDMLKSLLSGIHIMLNEAGVRLLFTIRSQAEGGEKLSFDKPSINEINLFVSENKLADMIDVEYFSDKKSADKVIMSAKKNNINIILSSHDFEKTPSLNEMIERYKAMHESGADIIKLAVMPHDKDDVDKLLEAVSVTYERYPGTQVVGISMGELGKKTRIYGYKYGSCLTFAVIDKASAPGQVSVDEFK